MFFKGREKRCCIRRWQSLSVEGSKTSAFRKCGNECVFFFHGRLFFHCALRTTIQGLSGGKHGHFFEETEPCFFLCVRLHTHWRILRWQPSIAHSSGGLFNLLFCFLFLRVMVRSALSAGTYYLYLLASTDNLVVKTARLGANGEKRKRSRVAESMPANGPFGTRESSPRKEGASRVNRRIIHVKSRTEYVH